MATTCVPWGVVIVGSVQTSPTSRVRRLVQWVCCGLRGHVDMLTLAPTRVSLTCSECGRSSKGWDL